MPLNALITKLNDVFSESWDFDEFVSDKTQYFDTMTDAVKQIYKQLNLIILSGEYVNLAETEEIIKSKIDPIVDRILNGVYSSEAEEEDIDHFLHSFILPFQNHSIQHLKNLCKVLRSNVINGEKSIMSGFQLYGKAIMLDYNDFGIRHEAEFFEANCEIAGYDHLISVKTDILNDLIVTYVSLQKDTDTYYKDLLMDKCRFLISKISEKIGEDTKSYFYTFDFQDREIDNFRYEVKYYEGFWEENFFRNTTRKETEKRVQSLENQREENKPYSLADIYYLIRHYKDNNKNHIQIDNLVAQYEDQFNNSGIHFTGYEKRTRELALNFLLNNRFSFGLQNDDSWDNVIRELDRIKTIQDDTNVHNYFPYSRFLKKYTLATKQLLDAENFDEVLIEKRISVFDEILKLLFVKFEWCKDVDFQRYILDKDSSTKQITYRDEPINIFLASSFVLPINYNKVLNDCNYLKRDIEDIKSHLSIYKSLNRERKTIEKIRHDVMSSDRKQVEILGIFSAVVLFAAGEISIFKNTPSLEQASTFSLVFSYSLVLFVLAIWLITRDHSSFKASKIHIWIIVIIVVSTALIFDIAFNIFPWL